VTREDPEPAKMVEVLVLADRVLLAVADLEKLLTEQGGVLRCAPNDIVRAFSLRTG
jgi:hypothetical protein